MYMQSGSRPSQELVDRYPNNQHQLQSYWKSNANHQDGYWYDARQNMWVPKENQHIIHQQHMQLPPIHLPATPFGHGGARNHDGHEPHTELNHEDRHINDDVHNSPPVEERQKNTEENKNDSPKDTKKPQKENKT
ncbi:hypothetical protein BDR07DRAFT_1490246 [Suillus spraguei]|nr:hypothetical protein BDR07DRAFT_1490246 [Suillus spraguei]